MRNVRSAIGRRLCAWEKTKNASCDQLRVGQPLADNRIDEGVESVKRVNLDVAVVQPEGELVHVALKILRLYVVIDAKQTALEDREHGFNAVRSHAVADKLAGSVVYLLMLREEQTGQIVVTHVLVGVDRGADCHVLVNCALQVGGFGARDYLALRPAAVVAETNDHGLADRAASEFQLLVLMLVRFQATDERLVNLDGASQLGHVAAARFAQPVQHEPRGFLCDANFLGQLHRRDALARGHEQVHRVDPLVQWDVRSLEDSTSASGEVLGAGVAAVETTTLARGDAVASADRALHPIRPETTFQVDASAFVVGEECEELERRDGDFVVNPFTSVWITNKPRLPVRGRIPQANRTANKSQQCQCGILRTAPYCPSHRCGDYRDTAPQRQTRRFPFRHTNRTVCNGTAQRQFPSVLPSCSSGIHSRMRARYIAFRVFEHRLNCAVFRTRALSIIVAVASTSDAMARFVGFESHRLQGLTQGEHTRPEKLDGWIIRRSAPPGAACGMTGYVGQSRLSAVAPVERHGWCFSGRCGALTFPRNVNVRGFPKPPFPQTLLHGQWKASKRAIRNLQPLGNRPVVLHHRVLPPTTKVAQSLSFVKGLIDADRRFLGGDFGWTEGPRY